MQSITDILFQHCKEERECLGPQATDAGHRLSEAEFFLSKHLDGDNLEHFREYICASLDDSDSCQRLGFCDGLRYGIYLMNELTPPQKEDE